MKFSEFLIMEGLVDDDSMDRALEHLEKTPGKKLGEILIELELIERKKLTEALTKYLYKEPERVESKNIL